MGDLFRSEEMVLVQLFLQPEAAYYTVSELGENSIVQFRDLNENVNVFQRNYVNEVQRCDEMERKLRYIEAEVKKDKINIPDQSELPKAPNPREIIDLEAHLEKTEDDIKEFSVSAVDLKSNYVQLIELGHVLEKTKPYFNEQDEANGFNLALNNEDAQNASARGHLDFVTGVINRERIPGFEKMLWRICRGNIFLKQFEIEQPLEDPATGNEMNKTVFVAFFQGEQLKTRIKKVCVGFRATLYDCPSSFQERSELLKKVRTSLEDLKLVLNQNQDHRQRVLVSVGKELQNWSVMVSKMKAIYHTLNCFNKDVTKKCLIGECWVSKKDIPILEKALSHGSNVHQSSVPSFYNVINTNAMPPTYNRTNKFTQGFQNLIDSYGTATYREVNPALFTIITFPFLFAVMFGDVGHAIIMLLSGALLCIKEKKIQAMKSSSEIFNIFFAGRYIILLMGIFSLYTGFVYNDVFSKSMNIFGTRWFANVNAEEALRNDLWDFDPRYDYDGTPYFIGVDPAWQFAKNKIVFLNTFKMKLSIIFGVVHMIFGVCVSVVNFVHFRKISAIFLEFLPQLLLLCFLFLWMVVMMFLKWVWYSADKTQSTEYGTSCAPSVLIYFINMILFKEQDAETDCKQYMFEGQHEVQMALVFLSLVCIPVLLLGTPLYVMWTRKNKAHVRSNGDVSQDLNTNEEEEEPMSEIFIHQAIHTIEYVLSTISHTASYLRLWALSLAHAQLSEVLWNMVFKLGLSFEGYVGAATTFIIFAVWASFTVAILVLMEGLSAFLHTLRLHWVEFMSKCYTGLGHPFQPFSFKSLLDEGEST